MSDSDDFDFYDIGGPIYRPYVPNDTMSELREELNIISKKTAELSKSMIDFKRDMAALTTDFKRDLAALSTDFKRDLAALKDFIEAMPGGPLEAEKKRFEEHVKKME